MADKYIDKEHLSWDGLSRYTKDLKEWIFLLFLKVHARIGHVEEKINQVEQHNKATYSMKQTVTKSGKVVYSLVNDETKEVSGQVISIDSSKGIAINTWTEDLN